MLPDFTMPTPAKTQIVGTVVPKVKDQSLMDFNAPPEDVKDAHGDHVYKDHKGHYWAWVSSIPTWHPPVYPLTWGKWMMQVRQPNVHDMKTAIIQCIADRQDIAFHKAEDMMDSINFDAFWDSDIGPMLDAFEVSVDMNKY